MKTSGSVSDGIGSLHPSVIQSLNRKLHETHITEVLLRAGAYRTIQAVDKINIFYIIKISISRNFCNFVHCAMGTYICYKPQDN